MLNYDWPSCIQSHCKKLYKHTPVNSLHQYYCAKYAFHWFPSVWCLVNVLKIVFISKLIHFCFCLFYETFTFFSKSHNSVSEQILQPYFQLKFQKDFFFQNRGTGLPSCSVRYIKLSVWPSEFTYNRFQALFLVWLIRVLQAPVNTCSAWPPHSCTARGTGVWQRYTSAGYIQ